MTRAQKLASMKKTVWDYYKEHGRHTLPWRKTKNPYRILVSEIMLQQTQVSRVLPKYTAFIKAYPKVTNLARAPLRDVLVLWQGLGYNRRAKFLHQCAKEVQKRYKGSVPTSYQELCTLPGVGPYTAGAVGVFATNAPLPLIETNVRTVLLHHLFPRKKQVSDNELQVVLEEILTEEQRPREWYWALMDYGSHLKTHGVKIHRNSKHYTKQSTFKGSNRQVRGAILRVLTGRRDATLEIIQKETLFTKKVLRAQLVNLHNEGLVSMEKEIWSV